MWQKKKKFKTEVIKEPPFQVMRCDVNTFKVPLKIYWQEFMSKYLGEEFRQLEYELSYDAPSNTNSSHSNSIRSS